MAKNGIESGKEAPIQLTSISEKLDESIQISETPTKGVTATVDEAVRRIGFGPFHWLLVTAAGMCSASAVCEIVTPSYLLAPAAWATCDLGMEAADRSLLSAIAFIGMIAGTHICGAAADTWGRLPLLRITLLGDAALGIVSALLPDKRLFLAVRFLNGFLVAGPTSTAMAYLGEFHTEQSRAKALLVFGMFPGGASLFAAALAYLVLPLDLGWTLPWIGLFRSWRLFVVLNSMPALLTGLTFLWLPESPKFLLSTGRPQEALNSMRFVHNMNQGRKKEFGIAALVAPESASSSSPQGNRLLSIVRQTASLFAGQYLRNTVLMCGVLFIVVLSANGLLVWIPLIFNRMATFTELHDGEAATACEAIYALQQMAANGTARLIQNKDVLPVGQCGGTLPDAMFLNTGVIGVANILVGLAGAFIVNCVGKRNLLVVSLVLSGVCGALLSVLQSTAALLGLACGLIGLTSSCISIVVSVAVENYPTVLRATAVSLGMLAGRCGSMSGSLAFGALLETQCSAAFWGLGVLLAVAGLVSLLLPRRGVYAT